MNGMIGVEACEGQLTAEPVELRLLRRLEQKKKEVADLESAIAILKEQPKLLEALNVLRKVGI